MKIWAYSARLGFGSAAVFGVFALFASFTEGPTSDITRDIILGTLVFGLVLTLIIAAVKFSFRALSEMFASGNSDTA